MALPGSGVVNRGLQVLVGKAFGTADAFPAVLSIGIDDCATNFAASDTKLNDRASPPTTNVFGQSFDATPTRSSQTVTCVATIPTGSGNFTIRSISLHTVVGGSVSASSVSLFAGITGQSIAKASTFSLAITLALVATDNS